MRRVVQAAQLVAAVAAVVFVVMLFANEPDTPEPAPRDEGTALSGRAIYLARCASCHGGQGEGGLGPRLAGRVVTAYPDEADQIAVVTDGMGAMPAFGRVLDADEIRAVVDYTRTELGT